MDDPDQEVLEAAETLLAMRAGGYPILMDADPDQEVLEAAETLLAMQDGPILVDADPDQEVLEAAETLLAMREPILMDATQPIAADAPPRVPDNLPLPRRSPRLAAVRAAANTPRVLDNSTRVRRSPRLAARAAADPPPRVAASSRWSPIGIRLVGEKQNTKIMGRCS
ncbi:hypothetical protein SLEP1_g47274 [Rubroshorea leprosula]|uniref:Uncharacterized protein n=1 Tax=Rubroshorea leprosula TaxID=152421 RepID=A0AAV5LQ02_9ROSI|nr:hypothetical protein SLEP1_g47274 [Rubroshorea leprosula]